MTRRAMLGALARACAGLLIAGRASARATGPHPDPRPGIDASHLPPPEKVAEHPDAVPAYDEARTIPEILDRDPVPVRLRRAAGAPLAPLLL